MASHPIVHFEIPAQDVGRTAQFYADVFGWRQDSANPFSYMQLFPAEGPGGAVIQPGPQDSGTEAPAYAVESVLLYIGADDIDASLDQIRTHGGEVIVPQSEIPQTGWFAIFRDPAGNQMALFKPMPRG